MSPLAALLLDWVLTAFWPLIGAVGMRYYDGITFSLGGMLVGLLVFLPWLVRRRRWRRLLDADVAGPMMGIGFFSATATAIYISALAYTTPSNAAIMGQVEVLYSMLLCAWLLKEPLTLKQGAASALVMGGTGLIMLHDLESPRWRGDLMILATPWMYQCSHIFAKRLPAGLDPMLVASGRVLYGIVGLSPWVIWNLWDGARWSWEPAALGWLLVQGVGMSSVNYLLWYMAILRMDLAKATTIILSYPALTVLFSWVLGQETIHLLQLAGLGLAFAGAAWTSRLVLQAQARHA